MAQCDRFRAEFRNYEVQLKFNTKNDWKSPRLCEHKPSSKLKAMSNLPAVPKQKQMTWFHFSRIKSAVSVIVLYERVTRCFRAPIAYVCVLTYEKSLNSSLNMCWFHHIHHEKSACVRPLKSSCNVTSLNLRLHSGNLSWIALSLNFLSLYPFSRLLPSVPRDWHPGCAMSDLQSGYFLLRSSNKVPSQLLRPCTEESPLCINKLYDRFLYTKENLQLE